MTVWGQEGPGFIFTSQKQSESCTTGRSPGSSSFLSGQENTDPALGRVRRGIWKRKLPSCVKGQIWEVHSSGGSLLLGGAEVRERGEPWDGSRTEQRNQEGSPAEEWVDGQKTQKSREGQDGYRWRPWMQGVPGTGSHGLWERGGLMWPQALIHLGVQRK